MTERIRALSEKVLNENIFPEVIPLSRNIEYDSLPEAVMTANNLRDYMLAQKCLFLDGELLSCGMKFDGCQVPSCAYKHTAHRSWGAFFQLHSDYQPNSLCFVDWNHYCNNYAFIVNNGISAYLSRIAQSKQKFADVKAKIDFLNGLEIVCAAIKGWADNFADAYESVKSYKIAANCRKVPYYPAETFYEAVQSIWFAFLLMPDSLGRLDQVLYPYYKRDIESGKLDYNTAYELICELLLKVFAHIGPSAHRSGDNTLVVGGYTETYEDGFNEVSKIIIEAVASLPTWRPQLSFRWTKKTPFAITQLVTELNMKCKQIVFTNDEVRLKAFDKLGFEKSDAINYTMIGCNEWAITGKSNTGSDGFFNTVKSLEEVLYHHTEEISKLNTFEEFYTYYEKILYQHIVFMCDLADAFYYANAGDLNILSSLLIEGCIEKAQSLTAGGAKYNVSCWSAIGIINLADSLSVIKKFIYEDKNFTFDGLYKMLKANWNGYENTRMEILKRGSFFGNDNDDADSMVNRIVESLNRLANLRKPKKGGEYRFGCYTGYNSAHITMGKRTRATPDGRYDGYNFTGALTAGEGKDKNGMTAFLNSAAKIDYSIFTAPLAVNLKLDKSLAKYPEKLAHIFDTYFETGGMQLQPDYLSTEELRYAQINPQEYSTLRVRVTGFSGFFTSFDKDLQNEIINRTEHGKQ